MNAYRLTELCSAVQLSLLFGIMECNYRNREFRQRPWCVVAISELFIPANGEFFLSFPFLNLQITRGPCTSCRIAPINVNSTE